MSSGGVLVRPAPNEENQKVKDLWDQTWQRLERFLPDLKAELFPPEPEVNEKPEEPVLVENEEEKDKIEEEQKAATPDVPPTGLADVD